MNRTPQLGEFDPPVFTDLTRIRLRRSVESSDEHLVQLMFDHRVRQLIP